MSDTKVIEFKIEGDPDHGYGKGVYKLQFDFNELVRVENLTGLNLLAFADMMSAGQTRGHVFAALVTHHPKVTMEEVGELLTKARVDVLEALEELYETSKRDKGGITE